MRWLILFLSLLCLPLVAFAQEDEDPGYLAGLLQDALSTDDQNVRIRGFQGALSSTASIALIAISDDDGEWFRAENVVLDWNRSALLRGAVDVNAFTAERVVLSRLPAGEEQAVSAEAEPFSIPQLPVSVSIGEISVPLVELGAPVLGEAATFSVSGSALVEDDDLDVAIDLQRTDGRDAEIVLETRFIPSTRVLTVTLDANEAAGGVVAQLLGIPDEPALSLQVQGDAPIDDFTATIALATDGIARISGDVTLLAPEAAGGWDVEVDISGDPSPLLTGAARDFLGTEIALLGRVTRDAAGRTELRNFELATRTLTLDGQAEINASGWPESLDASGRLANPDGTPVVLPFGNDDTQVAEVTFDAQLNGDLTFDAVLSQLENPALTLEEVRLIGRGDIDQASFAEDGTFELNLNWDAEDIQMTDASLDAAIGDALRGAARVDYQSGQSVRITSLETNGEDYGVSGSAVWDFESDIPLNIDLRLAAQDLIRFSGVAGRDLAGRADARISGAVAPVSGMVDVAIDATTLDLAINQLHADRLLAGVGTARVDVRRDETGTTLRSATVITSALRLNATGNVTSEESAFRFDGRLNSLDRLFPGEAEGAANLNGAVRIAEGQLSTVEVDAALENASGRVVLPALDGLSLDDGSIVLNLTGGPDGAWTTRFVANDIVSGLGRASALTVAGEGGLSQTDGLIPNTANGTLSLDGSGVVLADAGFSQALGSVPKIETQFAWEAEPQRLSLSSVTLTTDAVTATGTARINDLLSAPSAQFSTSLSADSLSRFSRLLGLSLRGSVQTDITGTYDTDGPFDIRAVGSGTNIGIGNSTVDRLVAGASRFDTRVVGNANALTRIEADVQTAEISATVSGPLSNLNVDARLRNVGLLAPDFQGPLSLNGTVGQQANAFQVNLDLDGPGGTTLRVNGQASGGSNNSLSINGAAPLGLANAFIEPRRLNGRAMLDLQMRGPLALQSLSGTITPDAAQFSAPTLGIILNPISGVIQLANGAAQLDLRAPGNNGGTLGVTGRVGLASFEAGLTASLDRFGIRDPSLYDTSVTGAVQLTGPIGRNLLISGNLRVNETEIQVPTSGLSSLSDIPNIEHLGATRPVMRTIERAGLTNDAESNAGGGGGSTTRLDLLLTAPAQVFVRGRGLDAELGGSLRLTGPTSDIIPQGGFELIRGRLDILNQRFELDEGRIQLSGSFDPVLRFVAVTEANDIEVRIILDGPASAPDISFTSSPELPEDEVLAQLLFGRNLSNLSALQALELASAVAALAGGGAGGLLSDLRDSFGLDDLDVSEGADGGTAVRAGKYISENIYSDVVVESGGRTEINLNLDITTDITARGSVDNTGNSSLGIFFERDY